MYKTLASQVFSTLPITSLLLLLLLSSLSSLSCCIATWRKKIDPSSSRFSVSNRARNRLGIYVCTYCNPFTSMCLAGEPKFSKNLLFRACIVALDDDFIYHLYYFHFHYYHRAIIMGRCFVAPLVMLFILQHCARDKIETAFMRYRIYGIGRERESFSCCKIVFHESL